MHLPSYFFVFSWILSDPSGFFGFSWILPNFLGFFHILSFCSIFFRILLIKCLQFSPIFLDFFVFSMSFSDSIRFRLFSRTAWYSFGISRIISDSLVFFVFWYSSVFLRIPRILLNFWMFAFSFEFFRIFFKRVGENLGKRAKIFSDSLGFLHTLSYSSILFCILSDSQGLSRVLSDSLGFFVFFRIFPYSLVFFLSIPFEISRILSDSFGAFLILSDSVGFSQILADFLWFVLYCFVFFRIFSNSSRFSWIVSSSLDAL